MKKHYHPPNGYCDQHVNRKPPRKSGTCGNNAYYFYDGEELCQKHYDRKKK